VIALTLDLPYPPSLNSYWRHPSSGPLAGRHLISEQGRAYRAKVCETWRHSHIPRAGALTGRLSVEILAFPPDRRRRDLDNIPKAVLDALTHAGVWLDDSQIDRLSVVRQPAEMGGRLRVTISAMLENNGEG